MEVSQKDQWRVVALGPPLGSTIGSRDLACALPGNIVIAFKFHMPCTIQPQQPSNPASQQYQYQDKLCLVYWGFTMLSLIAGRTAVFWCD